MKWHTFTGPEAQNPAPDFCLTSSTGDTLCDFTYRQRMKQVLVFPSGAGQADWMPVLDAFSDQAEDDGALLRVAQTIPLRLLLGLEVPTHQIEAGLAESGHLPAHAFPQALIGTHVGGGVTAALPAQAEAGVVRIRHLAV